jgi:hypothetical protein
MSIIENGSCGVAYDWKTELPGIFSRHADSCPVREGGECNCGPLGYRSSIRDWETSSRSVSPMYETIVEALSWQRDQVVSQDSTRGIALDRGELGALIDEFLQAAEDGRAGVAQSRDNVRALRGALSYVDSELGTLDVQDVRRRHIQALLDQLGASGIAPARLHAIVDSLQALYAYAIKRELVGFSPVVELQLPQSENGATHNGATHNGVPHAPPAQAPPPLPPPQEQEPVAQGWTSGELWTAAPQVGDPWTPPPYSPPPNQPPFTQFPPQSPPYAPPGYATGGFASPYVTPPAWTGPLSTMLGAPPEGMNQAHYDATMQERWLWWTVRIIVIVFVLIALVLVAESV